jgi:protein-S-isoprenylcysteine O-methyltransferase Ste14
MCDEMIDLFHLLVNSSIMLKKHLVTIFELPVIVILIIPIILVSGFHYVPFWGLLAVTAAVLLFTGMLFVGSGLILLFSTISLFTSMGEGTIAPWAPTNKLVYTGVYAYVRNPMLTGVFFVLIGESISIGSIPLTIYTTAFILANLIYIPLVEEPKLEKKFGKEYLTYKKKIPRWIPHHFRNKTGKLKP